MSGNQIRVTYTRGGREMNRRSFNLNQLRETTFGVARDREHLTAGLEEGFEVYVRREGGSTEISAHGRENETMESVLMAASEDREITGQTFIIDCTAEHKGADN